VADNKKIHFIPPLPPKREKRVGIYCWNCVFIEMKLYILWEVDSAGFKPYIDLFPRTDKTVELFPRIDSTHKIHY
jgi:hypothetical protein